MTNPLRSLPLVTRFTLAAAVTLAALALATPACSRAGDTPPIPAASDPEGKDLVKGAVVAAEEQVGGLRLYKIVKVDDLPDPIGTEYHLVAFEPKATTFPEAAKLWKSGPLKVAMAHIAVRAVHFLPRDHRVLFVEPVTDTELAGYAHARDSRRR